MASNSFMERLRTFHPPLPTNFTSLSNSYTPMKFAEAGWEREENVFPWSDELICHSCSVRHSGWSGESPFAAHRTKSPNCRFLNTTPNATTLTSIPSTSINETNRGAGIQEPETISSICNLCVSNSSDIDTLRRKLFLSRLNNDDSRTSYSRRQLIVHPFKPLAGGYLMLFESLRLTTYNSPISVEAAKWSRDGFIMISNLRAQCVFCGLQLEFDVCVDIGPVHKEKTPECPFVCHLDVGNITSEVQRSILEKERSKHFVDISERDSSVVKQYSIMYPEFESSADRFGTFSLWPKILKGMFPPDVMADAGFYYTGHNDMVRCFSCGVELFDWIPGADPLTQHACASPFCYFLQQNKGQEFINGAQHQELVVGIKQDSQAQDLEAATLSTTPTTAATSNPSSSSPPPAGPRPYLDLESISAARARGQFPDSPLLLGLLKAGTDNHKTLCDKTQENLDIKSENQVIKSENQVIKSEVKAKDTEIQAKDTEIQAKERELQRQRFERHWRELAMKTELEQVIEEKDQVIEKNLQVIEKKDQVIEKNLQVIEKKDEALHSKDLQLSMLRQELEEIRERLRPQSAPLDRLDTDAEDQSGDPDVRESQNTSRNEDVNLVTCQMCLDAPMQVLLRPCNHLCCCALCVSKLDGRCPICRQITTDMEKVYVS
ncbi:E3 ubiquitin-protein ligase XIAP [Aplysia californica]|uniref:E3 ubiquitin-protein ligase XIAP n=1 Tax=Aplysia californica TaxID=6500 RepID=A0ABM1VQY4_APLCA|nr:E3 ubiquitin-protein ligase XIAP [Aplysia californica]